MTISANDRVFCPEHPEFGFGIVKLVDGGLLDDNPTCQVAFDWKPGLEPVPSGSLRLALKLVSGQPLPEEAWGGTEELQRRLGAALAISENSRTGAFNRSVTKPLPHQAYLLDKIVAHNRYGHVIADDVGMGKTIEAGLLIVTERQRNPLARIDDKEREVLHRLTRYVLEVMTFKDGGPGDALTRALALHTFQKIAASSWVALEAALNNRLTGRTEENDRVGGEGSMGEEFAFAGGASEAQALEDLLERIRALPTNSKWEQFKDLLVPGNGFRADGERILIFTQYRRTQEWLKERLEARGERVAQIHGGLNLDERKAQREFFEGNGTIMISTEAGSEGANLHRKCHLEINYDIPWNPMRLLQRIGRLDRYGQKHKVRVVNLRAPSSWDSEITLRIDQKLLTVQQDMGLVADEDYRTMILGDIHESISVAKVMFDSKWGSKPDKIDDAVNQALRETLKRQKELKRLFDEKLGMPENYDKSPAGLDADDFRHAFSWAAAGQDVALRETRTSENKFLKGVYHFTLPDAYKVSFRASKSVYLVFDRDIYSDVKGEVLGTARGQSIRPSLGGFGDPVTDWFFKTSLQSRDAHPAFAMKRPEGMSADVCWWVAYTARWKRATQWAGPHSRQVKARIPDSTGDWRCRLSRMTWLGKGSKSKREAMSAALTNCPASRS